MGHPISRHDGKKPCVACIRVGRWSALVLAALPALLGCQAPRPILSGNPAPFSNALVFYPGTDERPLSPYAARPWPTVQDVADRRMETRYTVYFKDYGESFSNNLNTFSLGATRRIRETRIGLERP